MTTVLAIEKAGDVTFASDSQVSVGGAKHPDSFQKVFRNGDEVFGLAGRVRAGNVLRFMDVPRLDPKVKGAEVDRWVTVELIPAMQHALTEAKAAEDEKGQLDSESHVLAAVRGRCYRIGADFSWFRTGTGVYGIGSGSDFAMGALLAGADILEALKIAARLDSYTGGKLSVVSAKGMLA